MVEHLNLVMTWGHSIHPKTELRTKVPFIDTNLKSMSSIVGSILLHFSGFYFRRIPAENGGYFYIDSFHSLSRRLTLTGPLM
jgi:hypothetical protein